MAAHPLFYHGEGEPEHPQDSLEKFRDHIAMVAAALKSPTIQVQVENTEAADVVSGALFTLDLYEDLRTSIIDWFRLNAPELGVFGEETVRARAAQEGAT
jgi:hypothetical protein